MRTALTIAGSDSGGGAGIQADLKTFAVHGVFGTSAITAVTAQNTRGVRAVSLVPVEIVLAQVDAVLDDLGADAIKIGMLGDHHIARAVATRLARETARALVLDPVMVAKGGTRLVDDDAIGVIRRHLMPLSTVVTANVPEAEALSGLSIRSTEEAEAAARVLMQLGAKAVLVKGGHLPGRAVDVLVHTGGAARFEADRIDTPHTHGTGCTLAAAIAARLARGESLLASVAGAKRYVTWAIRHAPGLGRGHGPLGWGAEGLAPGPTS